MKVEKFEDLIAWQKARELTKHIYHLTGKGSFSRDFGLREQIQRAAVSIMSNLAEGFERGSRAEFHQFIVIAKASCAEVRSQLYTALDLGYITSEEFKDISSLALEVSRIIGGLKTAIRKQRDQL
ncbi:MAG: four helix bundle protein [Deltaproteobacteria bacterium]|nr:four helix bundle protein [Deltaproteobacteria bacterium]